MTFMDQKAAVVLYVLTAGPMSAAWTMPRRTRAMPARASPFSRRLLPLSSGVPVRPP